jgi:hypothetical protein
MIRSARAASAHKYFPDLMVILIKWILKFSGSSLDYFGGDWDA